MPKFELVNRGILRSAAGRSNSLLRLSVTPFVLRQIKALWSTFAQSYESVMICSVCCTAFFVFLSELGNCWRQLHLDTRI